MPKRIRKITTVLVENPHIQSQAAGVLLRRHYRENDATNGWKSKLEWRDSIVKQVIEAGISLCCEYCGRANLEPFPRGHQNSSSLTLDHFNPVSRSKDNRISNLVLACMPCNTKKGDRIPTEEDKEKVRTVEFLLNNSRQLQTI